MKLFDHEVKIKKYLCQSFDEELIEITEPYINLYVQTNGCNANCKFCIWKNCANTFNFTKYEYILNYLKERLRINKIGITGGEPTLNWDNFVKISEMSLNNVNNFELSLNTNGLNLDKIYNSHLIDKYYYINLSRHHYDESKNAHIFRCDGLPTNSELLYYGENQRHGDQLQYRCNLIKNYIDSPIEVFNYLNWMSSTKVYNAGFITLMRVNDYSNDSYYHLDMNKLLGDDIFITKKFCRPEGGCECSNYVYLPENFDRPIKLYQKNTYDHCSIQETLVYDGEYLRIGFSGDIIF
jgi:organic radical activating enzyme